MALRFSLLAAVAIVPLVAGCIIEATAPGMAGMGNGGPGPWNPTYGDQGGSMLPPDVTPTSSPQPSPGVTVPVIQRLVASPTSVASPDQEIALTCQAIDASGAPTYAWSATGGLLAETAGQTVGWRSPAQAGNYAVTVLVSSPSGGAVTGIFNITVDASLSAHVASVDPTPAPPTPAPTPTPARWQPPVWGGHGGGGYGGGDRGGYGGGDYGGGDWTY